MQQESSEMSHKYKIGVLCYSLIPATIDLLNRLTDRLIIKGIRLKAFPIVEESDSSTEDIRFSYRPSTFRGRFMELRGRVPENQLLTIQTSTILELVKECDLIILLGIQSIPAVLSAIFARLQQKPVLTINQTMPPEMEKKRPCHIRWSKKFVFKLAQLHIFQTRTSGQTLQEVYGIPHDKLLYAPFDGGGTFFKKLMQNSSSKDIVSIRNHYGIPQDAVVFIFVGTLIYLKGVDVLIDASAMLQSHNANFYLLIIGADGRRGGQLSSLQSKVSELGISNRVVFTGQKSMKELVQFYQASDVFVLPTRKDVWPKVMVEAALMGLPMITTSATGQANYLVNDGINGFVVPPNDVKALAHAMLKLMNPRTLRSDMGLHSRKIVDEFIQPEFETDRIAEGIESFLQSN